MGSAVKFKAWRRADKSTAGVFRAEKMRKPFFKSSSEEFSDEGRREEAPKVQNLQCILGFVHVPRAIHIHLPSASSGISGRVHDAARGLDENMTNCWHQQPREEKYFGTIAHIKFV